ncbi:hypothetical protein JANAI62_10700 [Jannaschia pagri]|uniref:Aspartate kinase n=1 Tax=Jannaschia pagri TaxID=2829797 RepID=A0ABQ4NJ58_9RHOB|nr:MULTISPECIES: ACT domain-containing protein [unclassified Jannaschia]GIT90615.1 hypothetical protein JANAI61_10730 [Jannaschia sp. AI_61]GIT94447.1 hypothetical protein JANAI62_10700 [Jannaschia sp. AI_62]
MADPVRDTQAMISGMSPTARPGEWAFVTDPDADVLSQAIATMREAEGLSAIVPASLAPDALPMGQITLEVTSALDGVGLTAAVSMALADAGIACNMVAGHHHDHAFVPIADVDRAVAILRARARSA